MHKVDPAKYYLRCLLAFWLLGVGNPNKTSATLAHRQTTSLHQAVIQGDIEKVKSLLQEGAKVNSRDQKENTPLHHAALHNHASIMELLLAAGARINALDSLGITPLHKAAIHGQLESMHTLLDHGAKVNKPSDTGITPLWYAVAAGQLEAVKLLLSKKATVNVSHKDGVTPLQQATMGLFELVQLMHKARGEVTAKNKSLKTAPERSPEKAVFEMVQCLIENGAEVNVEDEAGRTPLLTAVSNEYDNVTKLLIEHGAQANISDKNGRHPLHYAAMRGDIAIAQLLIEKGADVNFAASYMGLSPLMAAVIVKQLDMAIFLVEKGAWPSTLCHVDGKKINPIWLALEDEKTMQPFILHCAKAETGESSKSTYSFERVITSIIIRGSLTIAKLVLTQQEPDLNAYYDLTHMGETLLRLAVRIGRIDMIQLLIERGADVNKPVRASRKKNSETPLHLAARLGLLQVAELLITHGANVNATCGRRRLTPLQYALKYRQKKMVSLLEKHGQSKIERRPVKK